MAPFHILETKT